MTIPQKVIVPSVKEQLLGGLRMAVRDIQSAVHALRTISDFNVPSSADPAAWQRALDQATERREAARRAVNESLVLTGEQKAENLKAWRGWHKVVATHVNGIIRRLNEWPQAKWKWDGQANTIVIGCSSYELADEMASKPVPPECQEHAEKVDAVRQSILTLREWEQQHGIRKLPIEPLLKTDIESLCVQWATGDILRQHGLDNVTASRVAVFESTFI